MNQSFNSPLNAMSLPSTSQNAWPRQMPPLQPLAIKKEKEDEEEVEIVQRDPIESEDSDESRHPDFRERLLEVSKDEVRL